MKKQYLKKKLSYLIFFLIYKAKKAKLENQMLNKNFSKLNNLFLN